MKKTTQFCWVKWKKNKISGKIFHVLRIRRVNIVTMSVLPRLIYKFNSIAIKIPVSYFMDINKLILKFRNVKDPGCLIGELQSWRTDTTQIQDLIQSYSNWVNLLWAKEYMNGSLEQSGEPWNRFAWIRSTALLQRNKGNTMEHSHLNTTVGLPRAKRECSKHSPYTFHSN